MFQRILVPLDGSKRAERALSVAAALARGSLASVLLVQVTTPEAFAGISTEGSPVAPNTFETARAEATDYLGRLASGEMFKGVETLVHTAEGIPAEAILEASTALRADLIVMSSRGRSGLTRWLLGSVTQKVTRHSVVPVLVVPEEGEDMALLSGRRAVRVLAALDGSSLAEEALLPAAQLSAALSAPLAGALHLVRVVHLPVKFEYGQDDALALAQRQGTQKAKAYLDGVEREIRAGTLSRYRLQVTASVELSMDIADTLLQVAERGEYDVMALATHGRSGTKRWVMGSIAERILGATRLPLLIVHTQRIKEQMRERTEPIGAATPCGNERDSLAHPLLSA